MKVNQLPGAGGLLGFILLLWGCGDPPVPRSIILCDFTSSVDDQYSIPRIKSGAMQIQQTEEKERQLEFYAIGKDNNSNSLYYSNPPGDDLRPSDMAVYDSASPQRRTQLKGALDTASSAAMLINRKEPSSCIIDGVERAISYFTNQKGYTTASLRLYILSDMLECCRLNKKDRICIENEPPPVKNLDSMVRGVTDPALSLAPMKNLEVYIILSASNKKEGSSTSLKHFWEAVFKAYGYDKPLYFSVNLPAAEKKN